MNMPDTQDVNIREANEHLHRRIAELEKQLREANANANLLYGTGYDIGYANGRADAQGYEA